MMTETCYRLVEFTFIFYLSPCPVLYLYLFSVLQHSCSPNLFVQNVFVDTHDLRFPWVAFFASK